MAKTIEIPDELHDVLSAQAEREQLSLSEFIVRELEEMAEHQRAKEALLERIRNRPAVDLGISAAELIREGGEERSRQLTERWSSSTLPR